MTLTSEEKILEKFPHPTIQPIIGKPSYDTLAVVHLKLNTSAALVHSNRGNGQLGYLALTVKDTVYNTLSPILFITPVNSGQYPVIPPNSTGPQIADIRRQHQE